MERVTNHTVDYIFGGVSRTIYYLAAGPGNGPLIILVHGWPAVAETWKPQILYLSSLGYRVIATDNPGYGGSTARLVSNDYSLEVLLPAMLAVLRHAERREAVWIGHDWGAAMVWSLAAHHPEACVAVANIAVPYMQLELGLEQLVKTINRDIYPLTEFPNGQWDYQFYYQSDFSGATAWLNSDIAAASKLMYIRSSADRINEPSSTAMVTKFGGFLGGAPRPPFSENQIPLERTVLDEEMWQALRRKMLATGFETPNSYYINQAPNRAFTMAVEEDKRQLQMPTLFIDGEHDIICSSVLAPRLSELMRQNCKKLTEKVVKAGHWVHLEKPDEINEILQTWLSDEVEYS